MLNCTQNKPIPDNLQDMGFAKSVPNKAKWDTFLDYTEHAQGRRDETGKKLVAFNAKGRAGLYQSEGPEVVLLNLEFASVDDAYGAFSTLVQPRVREQKKKDGVLYAYRAPYFVALKKRQLAVLYPYKQESYYMPSAQKALRALLSKSKTEQKVASIFEENGYAFQLLPNANRVIDSKFYLPDGKDLPAAAVQARLTGKPAKKTTEANLFKPARNLFGAWYQFGFDFGTVGIANVHSKKEAALLYARVNNQAIASGYKKVEGQLKNAPKLGDYTVWSYQNAEQKTKYAFVHQYTWLVFITSGANTIDTIASHLTDFYEKMQKHSKRAKAHEKAYSTLGLRPLVY